MDDGGRRGAAAGDNSQLLVDEDVKEEDERVWSAGYWKSVIFNFLLHSLGKKIKNKSNVGSGLGFWTHELCICNNLGQPEFIIIK